MQGNQYIPGQRLKAFYKMKGLTQAQLAEMLGYADENTISMIVNGRRKLTLDKARTIVQNYPDVSIAWLMGDSEYINEKQRAISLIQAAEKEGNLLDTGLKSFATLSGYQISFPFENGFAGLKLTDIFAEIKSGCVIEKDGSQIQLSTEELNRFENHICDIIENELKFLFYMKGERQ